MKRGAPMKRTAFARKAPPARAPRERAAVMPTPAARRGSYAASPVVVAMPKPVEHRRPRLLALAEGMPCLLRVPGVCVLLALGESQGEAGVTELARRLGLHKSTASRLLATLQS